MTPEEFRKAYEKTKAKRPKIFEISKPDPPATSQQIIELERKLRLALPEKYALFLREYGGGIFGLTNVFSAESSSDYFMLTRMSEMSAYLPANFIPFSDDHAGGLYGFRSKNGVCLDSVDYWNTDGGHSEGAYPDLLEFVASNAF